MDAYWSLSNGRNDAEANLLRLRDSLQRAFPLPDSGSFNDLLLALDEKRVDTVQDSSRAGSPGA